MTDQLINTAALMEWSGIHQRAALIRWLNTTPHPIPHKITPAGEICTTLSAVTQALAARERAQDAWVA